MDQAWMFGFICGAGMAFIMQVPVYFIIEKMREKRFMSAVMSVLRRSHDKSSID